MNTDIQNIKTAIAHDTLVQQGGAERVLDSLHEAFPEAPVFTLVFDPALNEKYKGWKIITSQLQTLYLGFPKLQYLLPIIPPSVDKLDFSEFDVVISSSSSFIKNIRVPKNTIHICYCHTPTRFLWHNKDYITQELPWFLYPFRIFISWYLSKMKKWDYAGAQRVTYFIANSKEVQKRIKQYYNRDSLVLYPGIDTEFWRLVPNPPPYEGGARGGNERVKKDYFLLAGRLQAHKINDLIIKIFNELGTPLHVVGTGRNLEYLKSIAKPNITFLGKVSDEVLRDEYSGALGYIYPQVEDFGLMPLEAAACGTATIGIAQGGSLETIIPGQTGELFQNYDMHEIKEIIQSWNPAKYNPVTLRAHAEKFSKEKFKDNIIKFVHENCD